MREIVLFTMLFCLFSIEPSCVADPELPWIARAVLHNFVHANIFHLAINLLVFRTLYRDARKRKWTLFAVSFVIATLSFGCTSKMAVGMSDILFATIGLISPSFKSEWWSRKSTLIFLFATSVMALLPFISGETHIVSFFGGILLARTNDFIKGMKDDIRKATFTGRS